MDKNILKTKYVAVDIALGDPGDEAFRFMTQGGYGIGGFTEDFGALTDFWDKDPLTGEFVRLDPGREAPDRIEFPITTKERVGVFVRDTLRMKKCPTVIRIRDYCGKPGDMLNYELLQYLVRSYGVNLERSDPQGSLDGTEAERMLTLNMSASEYAVVKKVTGRPTQLGLTGYGDVAINAVWYCDQPTCGACGCGSTASDGCNDLFAATDVDSSPYSTPYLLLSTDGGATWAARVITGATGNAIAGTCMGDKVLVVLEGQGIGYATKDGDYNDWTIVSADFADTPVSVWAVDAATAYAGATGGAVYKTTDGGQSWTRVLTPGQLATGNLTAIAFVDVSLGYLGGANGELILYEDGVFSQLADPSAAGHTINKIALVPDQPCRLAVGTSGGNLYISTNKGTTFTRVRFPGDGSGSVDDLAFAGPYGVVMFLVQTNADGDSRVLRFLSGHAGGSDVEVVTTYTQHANNGINAIAACSVNEAWAVGEVSGGNAFLLKVQ